MAQVVGEFNDWEKGEDVMSRSEDGLWRIHLDLAPGRYEYKFVLNHDWFLADPSCHETVHDGYGGKNSVMRVGGA
jgi:1,4-alpha-glucan branching enzyme